MGKTLLAFAGPEDGRVHEPWTLGSLSGSWKGEKTDSRKGHSPGDTLIEPRELQFGLLT